MWAAHRHQAARQIPPANRHREQEAQRRYGAVDGCRAGAASMLVQLEVAQILGRRGIGRTAQEDGETPDVPDVVVLRVRSQAPHHHVMLHALTERADRCAGRDGIHGRFLFVEGTP